LTIACQEGSGPLRCVCDRSLPIWRLLASQEWTFGLSRGGPPAERSRAEGPFGRAILAGEGHLASAGPFSRIEDRKFDVGRKSAIFHLTTVPRGDFNAQATKRTDFSAL